MENIKFICRYCNSEKKNCNSLHNHERLCKENPNRQITYLEKNIKTIKHSNQFIKAKEKGEKIESKLKGRESTFKGKHHSEETKRKLSNIMKEKIINGEFIAPYKRNHSSKVSYPEQYFMDVLKDLPVKYNYQVGLYQLDFAIPEKMIYVEIDGEQHYVDKKIVKHDVERTKKLSDLGWICLRRVRWAEYSKLSQNEKELFCEELKNELK